FDAGRGHLGQRIVDRIGRDLAMVPAHLAVLPEVDLRVDDQHGPLPPGPQLTSTCGLRVERRPRGPALTPPTRARTAQQVPGYDRDHPRRRRTPIAPAAAAAPIRKNTDGSGTP